MLNTGRQKDGWGKTDHGNNNYKSEVTELKARDASCPKGKKMSMK